MAGPPPAAAYPRRTKRKIVLVAPSFRFLGGIAVQADTVHRAWENDPDVTSWLVPFDPLPPRPLRCLLAINYVRTIVTQLVYIPLLIRHLRRADLVHVFAAAHTSFLLAALPAILVARLLHKPVVLNYHSGDAPRHLRRSRVAKAVLAKVDMIVVQSRYLQRVFASFGFDTVIVPNTIEFDRFRFKRRQQFAPRLLSTRNFEPRYNVECTIRAFRIVKDRYPNATLTLVGFGHDDARLRSLVRSLNLSGVIFAGRVPIEEIGRYYDAADMFVQTPNVDNMPLSVLQAFAAGVPVVSTDAGGVPTMLRGEKDGLLAPTGNHAAVAAQLLRLLENPTLAAALVESAFHDCRQYAWHAIRPQWLNVYDGAAPVASARRRQRVVVFANSFDPGGTERQLTELIRRLNRQRFEVHVACFHRCGAWLPLAEAAAASVKEFPIHGFARLSTLRQLLSFVVWSRRLRPAVLHCTGLYTNVFGLIGGALAGVPLRIASRREINPGRTAVLIAAQRLAYAFAHVVVANCRAAAIRLRHEGVPGRRIAIIRNGTAVSPREVREHPSRAIRVIVVANMRPEKGHDVLIRCLPGLLQKYRGLSVTLAGDGALRQALQQQCERLGIGNRVVFLGHREDIPELLAASDLLVLPSRSEAAPNAIIEAMAAGLPVVASAVGGVPELVKDGRSGRLVPPDDATALGAAIDAVLRDPQIARSMGRCGYYLARANHGFDTVISAYEALYTNKNPTSPLQSPEFRNRSAALTRT